MAGDILSDVSYISNRLPWKIVVVFGILIFLVFYFFIPWLISYQLQTLNGNMFRPIVEAAFAKRIHWFQWIGIAAGLICGFFALRRYYLRPQLDRDGERNASFFSRLFARFLD